MKHFKIGFLAVIAILAMSFTIASQTGAIPGANITEAGCYTDTDASPSFPDPNPDPQPATRAVTQTPVTQGTKVTNPTNFCASPYVTFCCYEVVSDGSGGWKIVSVRYQSN